jgi:hypothetical protein
MATAPQAIFTLFAATQNAVPRAVLSGIVGDQAHSFGYHLARTELPADDYSVVLPLDKQGDGGAASALDISLPPDLMVTVTNRLLAAAKAHDPRLRALREFCGTTDGVHTHPYDLSNGQDGPLDSWDSSHLWHVHLSFYRAYSENATALAPIADVIAGRPAAHSVPAPTTQEDEMAQLLRYVGNDVKHHDAVYLALGPGAVQVWLQDPAVLADRQARMKARGQDPTVQDTQHSRDYFGVVVGKDPEAAQ